MLESDKPLFRLFHQGTVRTSPRIEKKDISDVDFEPKWIGRMIDLTRNVRRWALLAAGAIATCGAGPMPVEAIRPAAGPALGRPLPANATVEEEVPSRPVPLLEGLLGGVSTDANEATDPRTIRGNSVESPTPSAVLSPPTAQADGRDATVKTAVADSLDAQIDLAIAATARRTLSIGTHTPWQIGHGMLAYRQDYVLRDGKRLVNAFEWVASNPTYLSQTPDPDTGAETRELPWFYLTKYGARPQRYTGKPYEFEGHPNQFLAFFALARIPLDFEFQVQGRTVTYGQMLYNAKMEINDREEVTWNLWAFAYYFDMNERWVNAAGEPWSMERLVATTLHQFSPTKSPCGGCHALFALASARNAYLQTSGAQLTGVWTRAHMHLEEHIALAKSMQNADGSFSANYFKGPGYTSDPSKRISTTGHTLEFLMVSLPQNRLAEPWVQKAIAALAGDLIEYQNEAVDVGGMYHAAHALVLYRERSRPQFSVRADVKTPTTTATAPANGRGLR